MRRQRRGVRKFLYENSLSLVLFSIFIICCTAQLYTGFLYYNEERNDHRQPSVSVTEYIQSGEFTSALFENWESEFLQIGALYVLSAFLKQKGSAHSNSIHEDDVSKQAQKKSVEKRKETLLKKQGKTHYLFRKLYENSLSLIFMSLFLVSFFFHASEGTKAYNDEAEMHQQQEVSLLEYVALPRFWFESFQNWQSEFLAVGLMTVLTIWFRQKDSPDSKKVDEPNSKTGTD